MAYLYYCNVKMAEKNEWQVVEITLLGMGVHLDVLNGVCKHLPLLLYLFVACLYEGCSITVNTAVLSTFIAQLGS